MRVNGRRRGQARQLLSHTAGIGLGDDAARYAPDAPRPELPDHMAARVAIALLLAGAVLAFWIAIRSRPRHRAIRIGAGGVGAALVLWPLWAAAQDYLFLFSILPGLWTWLGAASGLAGLGAIALALAPARRR